MTRAFTEGEVFYIGSAEIARGSNSWPITDFESAVARAREKCAKEHAPQIVVAIVAVIEEEKPPTRVTRIPLRMAGTRSRRRVQG